MFLLQPHKIEDIPKKPKKELVKKAGTGKPHKGAIRFQKSDSRRNVRITIINVNCNIKY